MHFDLTDLRLMVRVAECNSLTRGAEASFMSLPAASTRIKNLEESIGARLFNRTSQGVTLTPPGQAFVLHARTVLGQIEHLRGEMQEYAKGIKGHLRIFANTTALSEFLPPVLRSYLLSHPDVNIDLRERLSARHRARGVREPDRHRHRGRQRCAPRACRSFPTGRTGWCWWCRPTHALAGADAVDFAETLDLDQVGLHEASAIHGFLRQICDGLHRTLRLRIQVGNFEAACRMIEASVGVGVLPESAARRHAQAMAIRIVPLRDDWSLRNLCICVRQLDALPLFARDLVELLVADARSAPAGG
jgi:DNA-binding transcriptional LysR family regulator